MSCCLTRCGVARVVARARLLETGARRGVATKTGVQGWIAGLKKEEVLGTTMAYHEAGAVRGSGPLVLFLHGNPSSSYVWRNVIDTVVAHAPKVCVCAWGALRVRGRAGAARSRARGRVGYAVVGLGCRGVPLFWRPPRKGPLFISVVELLCAGAARRAARAAPPPAPPA
jgi:hypothetical protein